MSTRPTGQPAPQASSGSGNAGILLRLDAGFEALLGAFLVGAAATGLYRWLDLPDPASQLALVVFGLLFLSFCPILWLLSRAPRQRLVLELALANGAGALILAMWVVIWNGNFHSTGAAFVLVVAGILATLTLLEAAAARLHDGNQGGAAL